MKPKSARAVSRPPDLPPTGQFPVAWLIAVGGTITSGLLIFIGAGIGAIS